MDIYAIIELLKFIFLGIFIVLFVLEMVTKKSYKVYYHIAITLAVICAALLWTWPLLIRAAIVALFAWFTMRAIALERIGGENKANKNE